MTCIDLTVEPEAFSSSSAEESVDSQAPAADSVQPLHSSTTSQRQKPKDQTSPCSTAPAQSDGLTVRLSASTASHHNTSATSQQHQQQQRRPSQTAESQQQAKRRRTASSTPPIAAERAAAAQHSTSEQPFKRPNLLPPAPKPPQKPRTSSAARSSPGPVSPGYTPQPSDGQASHPPTDPRQRPSAFSAFRAVKQAASTPGSGSATASGQGKASEAGKQEGPHTSAHPLSKVGCLLPMLKSAQ